MRGLILVIGLMIATPAAASQPPRLTLEALSRGPAPSAPIDLSAFAPPPGAPAARGRFTGRLRLDVASAKLTWKAVRPAGAGPSGGRATLPPFDFALVQDGAALIPVMRGVTAAEHPAWRWVLEPGRVWREPGDRGWLRAGLPFALKERNADCVHNGVMTFAFRPNGAVSGVVLEMASETCRAVKFDLLGVAKASLTPGAVAGADAVRAAYRREVAGRLPVRPIADLVRLANGLDPAKLALAPTPDGDPPSQYGLVVDGVRYASACATRHGEDPYCDVMDLPSYSTAKSIVGAVGLMRLERLYPGTAGEMIGGHVPACAEGATWDGVRLLDALDMATGVYNSSAYEADEDTDMGPFFRAETHAERIAYTCTHFARRSPPGQVWVYRTADSYTLGAAMNDIDRRHGGQDYYADIIAPLWRSLNLSPTIMDSMRSLDGARQPWTAFGLTYHADDIVRIAGWLSDGARIDGRPVLDPAMLAAALQRDPAHGGLQAGSAAFRYKSGFWARDMGQALGCGKPLWIPFMSGFGGISVVLLPGGMTYYYYGDGNIFDWAPAAAEAAKIRPMCG